MKQEFNFREEDLVSQAIEAIRSSRRATETVLMRRLSIGYNEASRVLELLEERELVGPYNDSKPRKILFSINNDEEPDPNGNTESNQIGLRFLFVSLGIIALIITVVILVRNEHRKSEIEEYRSYLKRAENNLKEATEKAERERNIPSYKGISAENEKIWWNDSRAVFEFTLRNQTKHPVKKIFLNIKLTQYDPVFQVIAEESGWHTLDEVIKPNSNTAISITSNASSKWGNSVITDSILNHVDGFSFFITVDGAKEPDEKSFKEKEGFDQSEINRYKAEIEKYRKEITKRE